MQQQLTSEDIAELKMQKIASLIEEVLLDTSISVLHHLYEKRNQHRYICYKSDCPMRDEIPF